jgi:hypothetical protein
MPPLVVALAKLIPSSTAVLMFVKLNSMGARIAEVVPDLAVLAFLAGVYGAAAMLRICRPEDRGPAVRRRLATGSPDGPARWSVRSAG